MVIIPTNARARGLALLVLFFLVCLHGFLLRPLARWRRVQSAALCQLQGFVSCAARQEELLKNKHRTSCRLLAILQLLCSQAHQNVKLEEYKARGSSKK